jgi:cysteine desulfurase
MNNSKVYLDYAATTPVDERVLASMLPYFNQNFGNPSSIHIYGQQAEAALEDAREQVASLLNCQSREVIFTSCGSESDNLALRGMALAGRKLRSANHILISPVEHHAVSRTAQQLASLFGFELEYLPVDNTGKVSPGDLERRLREDTALVSVMYANNEIGTINPVAEIGAICRARGIPFHTDAVQAGGYLPVDVQALNVDLLSLGAHKFYGPKGVGVLYARHGLPLEPVQTGGSQEFGYRAGTQNVPYIVGLACAFELAQRERSARNAHLQALRDYLIGAVLEAVPDAKLSGHPSDRLPNHASFVFKQVDGNQLLMLLDMAGFACSSGSACKTGSPEPSEVLIAIGLEPAWALGSLRVTLGTHTSAEDIEKLVSVLPGLVEKSRSL